MGTVSDRILAIMTAKDVSYGELAKLTGIPKSALQRYATGQTNKIPVDRVEAIAKALNVDPALLFGWVAFPDIGDEANKHLMEAYREKYIREQEQEEDFSEYLEDLRTRPEMKELFHSSRGMTPEQIKGIVAMIENFKR